KAGTDVSANVAAEKSGANAAQPQAASAQQTAPASTAQPAQPVATEPAAATNGRVKASPLAKKLAADKGIDISKVSGSGDGGRVTKRDIDNYVPPAKPAAAKEEKKEGVIKTVQPFTQTGQESHQDIPLTQMRKIIARRLSE